MLAKFPLQSSAIQRVGLTDDIDWRNTKDDTVVGSPAVTFFAPTNKAFSRLPRNLKIFLFSPFGEKALKKLLQFHVVPEFVLHTSKYIVLWLRNESDHPMREQISSTTPRSQTTCPPSSTLISASSTSN